MNPLEELGHKYAVSKMLHDYLKHYWSYLRDKRETVKNVLEMGVETGSSLRMWEEFFPNARIWGIDINPDCKRHEGGRKSIFIGDQGDNLFLAECADRIGEPFDLIVDDGSHQVPHQIGGFATLFPRLTSDGVYVVEDTGGVVGDFELHTVNFCKMLINNVFFWPKDLPGKDWSYLSSFEQYPEATWLDRNIVGVAFFRWIVFIFKGLNPEDNPYLIKAS